MAKPKMTAEEKAEDEAYDRLEKARGHFAKAVIAADVETEMGLHTCGTAGLLDVMFDAEHEFLDAYFAHIDAMEAAEAKPGKSATPKSDAVAAATARWPRLRKPKSRSTLRTGIARHAAIWFNPGK